MKRAKLLVLLLAVSVFSTQTQPNPKRGGESLYASAQGTSAEKHPLRTLPYTPGLDLASMDKTADPCVDFYQYTCGGWMNNNPIPADQPSWDVYGKLADENQQFLWGVLLEASGADKKRNASEQKIGDYFQACMDETAIEKLADVPIKEDLAEIAALKSKDEFARYLGREHLTIRSSGMLFGFGSNQDLENSSQVIAFADAGGLGLPDRDYYTKTDVQSQEIRDKYLRHVQKMFELIGDAPQTAVAEAKTVMAIEMALANQSLTRVEQRDPYKLLHKMNRGQLKALTPHSVGMIT